MSLSTFKRDSNKVMRRMKKTKQPVVLIRPIKSWDGELGTFSHRVRKLTHNHIQQDQ